MFFTIHIMFGLFLTRMIISPWLLFLLAFMSHWLLDAVPHYYMRISKKKGYIIVSAADVIFAMIIAFLYLNYAVIDISVYVILGAIFFAGLPDLFYIPEILWNKKFLKPLFFDFHGKIQREFKWGWIVELAVFITLLLFLF